MCEWRDVHGCTGAAPVNGGRNQSDNYRQPPIGILLKLPSYSSDPAGSACPARIFLVRWRMPHRRALTTLVPSKSRSGAAARRDGPDEPAAAEVVVASRSFPRLRGPLQCIHAHRAIRTSVCIRRLGRGLFVAAILSGSFVRNNAFAYCPLPTLPRRRRRESLSF